MGSPAHSRLSHGMMSARVHDPRNRKRCKREQSDYGSDKLEFVVTEHLLKLLTNLVPCFVFGQPRDIAPKSDDFTRPREDVEHLGASKQKPHPSRDATEPVYEATHRNLKPANM